MVQDFSFCPKVNAETATWAIESTSESIKRKELKCSIVESVIHLLETVAISAIDIRAILVAIVMSLAHCEPNESFLNLRTTETDKIFRLIHVFGFLD